MGTCLISCSSLRLLTYFARVREQQSSSLLIRTVGRTVARDGNCTFKRKYHWRRVHYSCELDEIQFRHARSGSKTPKDTHIQWNQVQVLLTDTCLLLFQNTFLISFCRQLIKKIVAIVNKGPLKQSKQSVVNESGWVGNQDSTSYQQTDCKDVQDARATKSGLLTYQGVKQFGSRSGPTFWNQIVCKGYQQAITAVKEMRTSHGVHIVKDDQRLVGVTIHLSIPKY